MRQKQGLTLVELATIAVLEFSKVQQKLYQQVVLRNQSRSTLENYVRRIALFVLHFGKLPEEISEDEISLLLFNLHTLRYTTLNKLLQDPPSA